MQIFDVTPDDLAEVLKLNEDSVPHVSSIDMSETQWFSANAHYFRVARIEDQLVGFLIGLRPGLPYKSLNYRWFIDHYDDFAYIDRVAVSPTARRAGVASRLYADFAKAVGGEVGVMTCEVNIRPPNESSMRYHVQHGFVQVGAQETEGGSKEVALMEKKL